MICFSVNCFRWSRGPFTWEFSSREESHPWSVSVPRNFLAVIFMTLERDSWARPGFQRWIPLYMTTAIRDKHSSCFSCVADNLEIISVHRILVGDRANAKHVHINTSWRHVTFNRLFFLSSFLLRQGARITSYISWNVRPAELFIPIVTAQEAI